MLITVMHYARRKNSRNFMHLTVILNYYYHLRKRREPFFEKVTSLFNSDEKP